MIDVSNLKVPKQAEAASAHPIALGETVTVLRLPRSALPFIEGQARVVGKGRSPNSYQVKFPGDTNHRLRVVYPDYQRDPERMLEILLDLWRASNVSTEDDAEFDKNLLRGADELAQFLFGDRKLRRRVYHLIATSKLPIFKLGSMICARKSVLLKWVNDQEERHGGRAPQTSITKEESRGGACHGRGE